MKIMLDAGHGKNTAGKRSPDGSLREHTFNSTVAEMVRLGLANFENVEVRFSHDPTGNRDVPLTERTSAANNWRADVLVSIHANATGNGSQWIESATGIETYKYNSNDASTNALANNVQAALIRLTGMRNRGVKTGNLHMVRETLMDAILCECGFMTCHADLAQLKSDTFRQKVAQAIVEGLAITYGLRKKVAPAPKPTTPTPQPAPTAGAKTHKVVTGDSLWAIARKYGVTVDQLRSFNAGKKLDPLSVGLVLNVSAVKIHRVAAGDSLWAIARKYGTTVDKLRQLNAGKRLDPLSVGLELIVG